MAVDVLMKEKECVMADPARRSIFRINEFQSQDIIVGDHREGRRCPKGAGHFEGRAGDRARRPHMALRRVAQQFSSSKISRRTGRLFVTTS
jgi:hypothetical protein